MSHGKRKSQAQPQPGPSNLGPSSESLVPSRQPSPFLSSAPALPSSELVEPSGENGDKTLLDKLEFFVSEYRERKVSKFKALTGILGLLERDLTYAEPEKEKAINLYIDELNSIRHGDTVEESRPLSRGPHNDDIDDSVQQLLREVSHCSRSHGEISGSDSDDSDEPPSKRKKLKENEMPWYKPGESLHPSQSVSSKATCKSLRVFNRDIPGCKFWIKLAPGAPTGVPSPQWERIFKGEPIELDHFLSSLHRTSINEEGETRIGNAKISMGITDAKRRVSTAAEWSAAWHFAARAISFVFPHRSEELRNYGDYIEGEFAAKVTHSHPKVILFDIAVRNMVQGGQSILLTDQQHFLRLYSAIVMPDGVEYTSGKSANRRSDLPRASGSKTDICNRFNASGCPSSDSDCRYRHICKVCKKGGHGKEQCQK
jgi:hypothetical protein